MLSNHFQCFRLFVQTFLSLFSLSFCAVKSWRQQTILSFDNRSNAENLRRFCVRFIYSRLRRLDSVVLASIHFALFGSPFFISALLFIHVIAKWNGIVTNGETKNDGDRILWCRLSALNFMNWFSFSLAFKAAFFVRRGSNQFAQLRILKTENEAICFGNSFYSTLTTWTETWPKKKVWKNIGKSERQPKWISLLVFIRL